MVLHIIIIGGFGWICAAPFDLLTLNFIIIIYYLTLIVIRAYVDDNKVIKKSPDTGTGTRMSVQQWFSSGFKMVFITMQNSRYNLFFFSFCFTENNSSKLECPPNTLFAQGVCECLNKELVDAENCTVSQNTTTTQTQPTPSR